MSLTERFIETTAEVRDQATAYVARAAEAARHRVDRAAGQVAAARTPVEVMTEASLKLNNLSHQHLSRLLARQGSMLAGALVESEQRLQRLARAGSLQQALASQAADLIDLPQRIARNTRETWAIVADTGREAAQLAASTYAELLRQTPARKTRTRAPRTAGSRRPKTARKTAAGARAKKGSRAA